jgi:GT2 family glycosyltransferase
MKIYTIIVTYNAMQRNWIDRCMESLSKSTIQTIPVLIDNGSTDGTREHIPQHYPDAVWLPQDKNLGFGQANNVGIKYALEHNADYILLLNQDAALSPDAIEKMLSASDGESLLSPLHLNGDGSALDYMFRGSIRDVSKLQDDLLVKHQLEPTYETGEICAACWFMPVALIRRIGGFNPLFFHYNEDNNYYHRMTYHQVKTILVPHASMFHDRSVVGNIQAFNHKQLRRELLLAACNINISIGGQCYQFIKLLAHCYKYDLPVRHYVPGRFLMETIWLLCHWPQIRSSRQQEKNKGLNWIQ